MSVLPNTTIGRLLLFATALPAGLLVLGSLPLLTAFEAHVVNVTAKIEPRPPKCDPLPPHHWKKHDGCKKGKGESEHAGAVQLLSGQYGGFFSDISGGQICKLVADDHCSGSGVERARCEAKTEILIDYLNIATDRLDPAALLAGADDGSMSFDRLGLSGTSTIAQALAKIEAILNNEDAKKKALEDAAHVAERIWRFYENENPFSPECVYDPEDVPQCIDHSFKIRVHNENNATVENDVDIDVNTGGNSANGGDGGQPSQGASAGQGGDGGTVVTGDVNVEVNIENNVNQNETNINVECENCAEAEADASRGREEREARTSRNNDSQTASVVEAVAEE